MQKLTTMLLLLSIVSSPAAAQTTNKCQIKGKTSCEDVISAANKALAAKNKELSLADLAIKASKDAQTALQAENTSLKEESKAWYNNPVFMVIGGALIGAFAYKKVSQ